MINQRKRHGNFTSRPPSGLSSSEDEVVSTRPSKQRRANLYDAVAGNVTQAGILGNIKDTKASKQPLRPDEVLFKQSNAPIRYEETDYYFAHEKLPEGQQLPSGDLLSAIHAYISKLYSRTATPETERTWKCMDETALIAFGILLEETAREELGETGDLAFTEAADEEEERALASVADEIDDGDVDPIAEESGVRAEMDRSGPWSSSDDGSRYTTDESE